MSSLYDLFLKYSSYIVDGLLSFVTFIVSFLSFLLDFLDSLPSEVSGTIVLLFISSVLIVVIKATRSMI